MKTIRRAAPPACLGDQPLGQNWRTFMGSDCHHAVHAHLRQEQHGLCCYCETAIADREGHIEHMEPRSSNPRRAYDAANLAISCDAGQAANCGRYKDGLSHKVGLRWDGARFAHPHDAATTALFRYGTDGRISATEVDEDKANYMIGYLCLNSASLVQRRHAHAAALIAMLGSEPDGDLVEYYLQSYTEPDDEHRLKSYVSLTKAILQP